MKKNEDLSQLRRNAVYIRCIWNYISGFSKEEMQLRTNLWKKWGYDSLHMWCVQKQTQLLIGAANHTPLGLKFQRTHFLLDRKIYKKHGTSKSFGLLFKSEMTCCSLSLSLFSLILLFAFSLCQKRKQNDPIFFHLINI